MFDLFILPNSYILESYTLVYNDCVWDLYLRKILMCLRCYVRITKILIVTISFFRSNFWSCLLKPRMEVKVILWKCYVAKFWKNRCARLRTSSFRPWWLILNLPLTGRISFRYSMHRGKIQGRSPTGDKRAWLASGTLQIHENFK